MKRDTLWEPVMGGEQIRSRVRVAHGEWEHALEGGGDKKPEWGGGDTLRGRPALVQLWSRWPACRLSCMISFSSFSSPALALSSSGLSP